MPSETRDQKSQEGQQKQPSQPSQSDSSEIDSLFAKIDQLMGVMTSLDSRVGELEAKSRPPSPFLSSTQQITQQVTQLATQQITQPATQPAKQPVTQQKREQNEKTRQQHERRTLYQAYTETTAKKSSNIQAISTRNLGTLSSISH